MVTPNWTPLSPITIMYQSIRINQEHPKNEILTEVQFSDRAEALRNETKKAKEILPFINT